jgi:tetratricopeptide (TPR) repeat protein
MNRLGGVYDRKGDAKNATSFYQQAEEQRRALVNETHAADDEHDLAVTLYNRAGMDAELASQPADAQKRFEESCEFLKKIAKANPDKLNYTDSLAQCWFNWAHFHGLDPNKVNQALVATKNAKDLWAGLLQREKDSLLYQVKLAACLTELGKLHHLQQANAEALAQYREALVVYRDMVKRHPKVATYHGMLGQTCSNLGQLDDPENPTAERLVLLQEAVKELANAQGLPTFRSHLADALLALSRAKNAAGDATAIRSLDQSIARYEELVAQFPNNAVYRTRLETAREERKKLSES